MSAIPRPDSEAAWIQYLRGAGFDAAQSVPEKHHPGMVRVSRVGGDRLSLVSEQVHILVEVWDESAARASARAHDLNRAVEAVADGQHLNPETRVYSVRATGPVEFPDQFSALARYQFTATCMARRVAANPTMEGAP